MSTILGEVLENGTFYLDIPTGTSIIDPNTGNPIPNVRSIEVHAYLKCDEQPPKQLQQSQPNNNPLMWVCGWVTRVVDPLSPLVVLPPMVPERVQEMIKGQIGGVAGRFYPIVHIPNAALVQYQCLDIVGEAIWGWFDPSTGSR